MNITRLSVLKALKMSLALLVLALFMPGCGGGDSQTLSPVSSSDTILAFGDSLTEGYGVAKADSYPSVLSRLSLRKVINAGITGEVTEQGLNRLSAVIDAHNPYLMILLEGGNDILRLYNLEETKQNLSSMIDVAKGKGVEVVLLGVPVLSSGLSVQVSPIYQALAEEHDLVYDGDLIRDLLLTPAYKSDLVHFNKAGYQKMAEDIHQLLIDNGAL